VDGAGEALLDHLGVDVLDCLADPGELQPNPLLVVVEADLLSSLMVRLLQVFSELLFNQRLLQLLHVHYLQFLLHLVLLVVFAVFRLERQLFFLDGALLQRSEVVLQVLLHRARKESAEFLLVCQDAHIQLFDIQCCLCLDKLAFFIL
jgi:hypothetical protein